jgi:hypothetical protein
MGRNFHDCASDGVGLGVKQANLCLWRLSADESEKTPDSNGQYHNGEDGDEVAHNHIDIRRHPAL